VPGKIYLPRDENGGKKSKEDNGDLAEQKVAVGKYLTLRNFLAVILTIIGLATGFFAWLNKDYRSIMTAQKDRIAFLENEKK
jgi:hypothetical protein